LKEGVKIVRQDIWQVKAMRMGSITLDRSAMTHFKGKGEIIEVPIWACAATNGEVNIVIDTGLHDLESARKAEPGCHQKPDEQVVNAIKNAMGWSPADINYVINTHLHYDHCGGNAFFPQSKFIVQRTEWETAAKPIASEAAFYIDEFYGKKAVKYFQWDFADEEKDILPGLKVIPTPGHTRGHQSVLLNIGKGVLCVSGDICNVADNVNGNLEPNIVVNTQQVYESFALLRRCADFILPGHEPSIKNGESSDFPPVL
jgi:glyoxylase-like metal-dependent hydrolase (beta-lactamase superfamily II)